MSKKILRVFNALTTLLVAAAALLAILLVGVRAVGLTPFAVLSGSMEPSYHVGSLIYVKKEAPENIRV
ncbi:MAG TPA: S26 family signal peptidase, partial [Clostridia bacterium]|nr:S26 family signal peptidase [Clostridia bacterium]